MNLVSMKKSVSVLAGVLGILLLLSNGVAAQTVAPPPPAPFWAQWGLNPQHTGAPNVAAQPINNNLVNIIYDFNISNKCHVFVL